MYTYCRNNPILNHDPTGHGTKENSPYSRKEQQYIDAGADPDTAKLATQCYPDAKSKQDLYNKYKSQGYNATDAKKLANYEIVHGEERAKNYAANNVKKSGPDYTPTSPRDNVNTDWRTQNRLNEQKKAGAGKTSYGKSSGKYDTTADFLTNIENRNGKFYTDKATIDKIGQVEARGEDFSLLNKRIMSSRASTEGGTSVVYKYSDELGTKYLIHEVTDARGYIIHRDFDAVRISSGQLINKGH